MTSKESLIKIIEQKNHQLRDNHQQIQIGKHSLDQCQKAFNEMKQALVDEKEKHLSNKIANKWNLFWSVIAVFLTPGTDKSTLPQRIGMFFKTMYAWAKNGFKLEEQQVAQKRLQICRACPELNQETSQCKICGCMMAKKTKVSGASCPLKKW